MLYVPGCFTRFLNKARSLRVDSVIFDLGDSVLVENKVLSRNQVVEAILAGGFGRRELIVRVNDLDSPWGQDDVKAIATIGVDAVLFPNVESRQDVLDALNVLNAAGGSHLPIMVMIESPLAVLRAEEIAAASDRIACLVLATSDLITQLHGRKTPDRIPLQYSLAHVLLVGRAYKRAVVDGISVDIKDMHSFEMACRLTRDLGFDGKSLVHPNQLAYCNEAFTPKMSEITYAYEVIDALEVANREGRGTIMLNGRLVEQHHVAASKRIIALAQMIEELEAA